MTDTPTPDVPIGLPPTSSSTPPPPRPKRPWTILGRLSQAVREQNWFAVVLELAIVVLGVVIGFQVTSWGQDRSDQSQEQIYLRQLAADLRETEERIARTEAKAASSQYPAASRLLQTWGEDAQPPRDSVLIWVFDVFIVETFRPVLGTAEGLISTGGLRLIRNDSLRTAVAAYVEETRHLMEWQWQYTQRVGDGWAEIGRRFDFLETHVLLSDSLRNAMSQNSLVSGSIPTGEWTPPFPLNVEALYSDPDAYNAVRMAVTMHEAMGAERATMLASAAVLRARIESQIDR